MKKIRNSDATERKFVLAGSVAYKKVTVGCTFNTHIGMFKRSLRGLILLNLVVIAISGSPRFQSSCEHNRDPRHDSCPSCRGERADALVSWVTPARREQHDARPEQYPTRQESEPYRSSRSFYPSLHNGNAYHRALRSKGTPAFSGPRGTCKRENPFSFEGNLDFDVAPPQAAPVHSVAGLGNPSKPRYTVARSPARPTYQKSKIYDLVKDQSDPAHPNRYNVYDLTNEEPVFKNHKQVKGFVNPSKEPDQSYRVIVTVDKYPEDLLPEETPVIKYEQHPKTLRTGPASVQVQKKKEFLQYPRQQLDESSIIYLPEAKQKSYNVPSHANVYKVMPNFERNSMQVDNSTRWQNHREEEERPELKNHAVMQIDESDEPSEDRLPEEFNIRQKNNGYFSLNERDPQKEVIKETRQIKESNMPLEVISTRTTSQSTEQISGSSPIIMQIPRKVSTSN